MLRLGAGQWGGGRACRRILVFRRAEIACAVMWLLASLLCLTLLLGKLCEGAGDPSRLPRFSPSLSPCRPGQRERGTPGRPSRGIRSGVAGAAGIWELRGVPRCPGSCPRRRHPLRSPATVAPCPGRASPAARCPARGRRAQVGGRLPPAPQSRVTDQPSARSGAPHPILGRFLCPVSFKLV